MRGILQKIVEILDHQTAERSSKQSSDPAYYIRDWLISNLIMMPWSTWLQLLFSLSLASGLTKHGSMTQKNVRNIMIYIVPYNYFRCLNSYRKCQKNRYHRSLPVIVLSKVVLLTALFMTAKCAWKSLTKGQKRGLSSKLAQWEIYMGQPQNK